MTTTIKWEEKSSIVFSHKLNFQSGCCFKDLIEHVRIYSFGNKKAKRKYDLPMFHGCFFPNHVSKTKNKKTYCRYLTIFSIYELREILHTQVCSASFTTSFYQKDRLVLLWKNYFIHRDRVSRPWALRNNSLLLIDRILLHTMTNDRTYIRTIRYIVVFFFQSFNFSNFLNTWLKTTSLYRRTNNHTVHHGFSLLTNTTIPRTKINTQRTKIHVISLLWLSDMFVSIYCIFTLQ